MTICSTQTPQQPDISLLTKIISVFTTTRYPGEVVFIYLNEKSELVISCDVKESVETITKNNINAAYIQYSTVNNNSPVKATPFLYNPNPLLSKDDKREELNTIISKVRKIVTNSNNKISITTCDL